MGKQKMEKKKTGGTGSKKNPEIFLSTC